MSHYSRIIHVTCDVQFSQTTPLPTAQIWITHDCHKARIGLWRVSEHELFIPCL